MKTEVVMEMAKKEMSLTDLPGVGAATAEKLMAVGYTDLMSIAVATPAELIDSTGMGDALAKKLIAGEAVSLLAAVERDSYKRVPRLRILQILT